ncbi:hypothetical protein HOH87_00075 [bacterium]|jgi:collagenase-like PrtC family protease|nr:hypothetical protein [bacterium]
MTTLSTFVTSLDEAKRAVDSGATALILDHPCLSLRHTANDDLTLETFINNICPAIQSQYPTIPLSWNADILFHDADLEILKTVLTHINTLKIPSIRIQDAGVIPLIQTISPDLSIHFASEMGNNNWVSIQAFEALGVRQQTLTNEVPISDIKVMQTKTNAALEIQVQGPILIQYSRRHLLKGAFPKLKTTPTRVESEDTDLPNRRFMFQETAHGHLMYGHFHRCLIPAIAQLKDLNLASWLVDCRGESDTYTRTALQTYSDALLDKPAPSDPPIDILKKESRRSQKLGFFLANMTDKDWRDQSPVRNIDAPVLAMIIDTIKGKCIIGECMEPIDQNTKATLTTPENKVHHLELDDIRDLNNQAITRAEIGDLIRLPWQKGCTPKSILTKT